MTATGSTSTLEFAAANGPSQWDLDKISLTANGTSSTTPPAAPVISTGVANANESVSLTGTAPDGGTVTVTVSDGGPAALGTATANSTTGAWTFTTADLAAGSYAFTATDTTSAGASAASSPFGVTVTSSSPPKVSSVVESPSSDDLVLGAGKTVTLTLDMSKNVTVNIGGDKPTLTLNDGGTATYTGGSGTSVLTFTYKVAAGQNTPDLSVTKVNLNGATIHDGAGNAANLSLSGLTQTGPQIDTSTAVTVGAGATLQIAGADSGSVTFAASTGMLKLDTPSTFSGEIFNFTGNGTLSGSDQIDLTNIYFNSVKDRYGNGVLTVTDGTHTDKLNLNGSYSLANFSFASDGSGGTIVYDPPAPTSCSQNTAAPNGVRRAHPNRQPIGTGQALEVPATDTRPLAFTGSAGTLILDGSAPAGHALDFTGPVSEFGEQNVIDLPGFAFDGQTKLGYSANSNQTGGALLLVDGTHSANIALLGNYMASSFAMASDGHGGTVIAEAAVPNGQSLLTNPHHA